MQLAVNPGSAPERVGVRHFPYKIADLWAPRRPPGTFASGLEPSEQLEAFFMPTHRVVWLDNDQSFPPVAPETGN